MKRIIKINLRFLLIFGVIFIFFLYPAQVFSGFSDSLNSNNMQISTSCWAAPDEPVLISPDEDFFTNLQNVIFSWEAATSDCPEASIFYKFQIYTDSGAANLYHESGWGTTTSYTVLSMTESQYWWRVQVKDQYENITSSELRQLTIDKTSPSADLLISESWTKAVEEKFGSNYDFELGNFTDWTKAGNVNIIASDLIDNPSLEINPYSGAYMTKIGNPEDPGNWVWENRLMKSIEGGVKSLSFYYNFFSRDLSGFDTPGFFVRLDGQEIFSENSLDSDGVNALNTGWQQFYYDLSGYDNPKINLSIYAGNTGDTNGQSWVYIDRITSYFISSSNQGLFSLNLESTDQAMYKAYKESDPEPLVWSLYENPFNLESSGVYNLKYKVTDQAGNSTEYSAKAVIDNDAPEEIDDLNIDSDSSTVNSILLEWTSVGNDGMLGRASSYDIRYQKDCSDITNFDFATALRIEKVPSPQIAYLSENLEVIGLNPSTDYCFAVKTADEAPNWSELSNVVIGTTLGGSDTNYGDLIINEMFFGGSSVSYADEWLELRNMTDHDINLTGFYLTKLDGGGETTMSISLTGKTISSNGYFLIANGNSYVGGDSQLNVSPDIWDSSLDLSNDALQIKLYDSDGDLIDTAWDGTVPTEGLYDSSPNKYYSMERISVPGDGASPLSWYTCIDGASTADFFDGDGDERGTPGSLNRSENEPLAHQKFNTRILPIITQPVIPTEASLIEEPVIVLPDINLNLSENKNIIGFVINNIKDFSKLYYELNYETDSNKQGVIGESELKEQNEFRKEGILLGSCSAGGTCVYHTGIKNIILKIIFENKDGDKISLEKLL